MAKRLRLNQFAAAPEAGVNGPMRHTRNVEASLIVTCKGRRHHLERTLGRMLGQEAGFPYEVVIVDYGCPQRTFDWCRSLEDRRLVCLRVEEKTEVFNLSRARNCGAKAADGDFLLFVDADVILDPRWLATVRWALAEPSVVLVTPPPNRYRLDLCGTCGVRADTFHAVRGYDESIEGWAPEDHDFYARCGRHGQHTRFDGKLLRSIRHSDAERTRFYRCRDRRRSLEQARSTIRNSCRQVNPSGYGRGPVTIWRGGSGAATGLPEPPPAPRRYRTHGLRRR